MPSSVPEPLSVEDARILALEEGPVRGHTCKLVLLDGVRGVDELLERFAEHWAASPRVFTLNVSNVPGPPGPLSVLGAPVASMHSLAALG